MIENSQPDKRWVMVTVTICLAIGALVISIGTIASAAPPLATSLQPPGSFQLSTVTLPISSHPVALTIQPQTGYVYVASTGRHEIPVINGTTVMTTISPFSVSPVKPCLPDNRPSSGLYCLPDIEAHPVTGYVYVTEWQTDYTYVITGTELITKFWKFDHRWNGPATITVDPNSEAAYVGNVWSNLDRIGFICGSDPVAELEVDQDPIALAVDATTGNVYVAERGEDRVTVIKNTGTCSTPISTTTPISVGQAPTAVGIHPQTGLVYVVNGKSGDVSVINGTDPITAIPIGGGNWPLLGPSTFDGYVENGSTQIIAFGPKTGYVYVSNWVSNTVLIINNTEIVTTLAVGGHPNSIVASPFSGRIYVANTADSTVSVIDQTTVLTTLNVAAYPIEMAVHPDTGDVYVVGRDDDAVTVIHEIDIKTYLPLILKNFGS